ncbi:hypothetical protein DL96DRAFT_624673 [Flagelloscypha sp. PMI_526]|nr:hypothetical protein DL96DRAFT_624673 [Flagelloscypha sp. PMI_526]
MTLHATKGLLFVPTGAKQVLVSAKHFPHRTLTITFSRFTMARRDKATANCNIPSLLQLPQDSSVEICAIKPLRLTRATPFPEHLNSKLYWISFRHSYINVFARRRIFPSVVKDHCIHRECSCGPLTMTKSLGPSCPADSFGQPALSTASQLATSWFETPSATWWRPAARFQHVEVPTTQPAIEHSLRRTHTSIPVIPPKSNAFVPPWG